MINIRIDTGLGSRYDRDEAEGDISYEPYRHNAQPAEKRARRVSFQIPHSVSSPIHDLSAKLRHGRDYRQISTSSRRFWNPVWLSGPSFLLFGTWFMLLVVGTAALYLVSQRNAGIAGESYTHRYAWTYGPTAVLAVTLSLWYHVDFWCKELTPWARMRRVATPSSHGLLRDYLTKFPLVVIWQASRAGDHAVWTSSLGTFLLHLATIVSTSLLVLQPSAVSNSVRLTVRESFVSTSPNISVEALSGNALVRYFGIQSRNLTYPVGTSPNLTVATFLPTTGYASNSTFAATVPGMSASLDCEPIPSSNTTGRTSQPWLSILAPVFTTNISMPDCNIIGVPVGMGISHDPPVVNTVASFQGWWNNYTCNDGVNNAAYPEIGSSRYGYRPFVSGFTDRRLVFVTSYIQWTGRVTPNITRRTWVQNFTGIICKPRYTMDFYSVRMSPADLNTKQPYTATIQKGTSQKIPEFADSDIGALIKRDSAVSSIVTDALRMSTVASVNEERGYLRTEDPLFVTMWANTKPYTFSNSTEMLRRIPQVFSGIAAQAFQEYFTEPDTREIDGTVQSYQVRLRAKALPVGLILSFLSILIIISIALVFLSPWDCITCDPHPIAAKAKLLASSPALSYQLRALNGLNMHQVQASLAQRRYKTIAAQENREFVIVPTDESLTTGHDLPQQKATQQGHQYQPQQTTSMASNIWWTPLNHRIWFLTLILVLPILSISLLEGLQHLSNTRSGILDVTNLVGSRTILITLIPATLLSIIALMYQGIHLSTCITSPFNALNHGGVSHERGLTLSMLGKTSPHVFIMGLRSGLYIPCLTALGVIIGSFLTIVVSGLYYVQDVPLVQTVELQRMDFFNFTARDLSLGDGLAGVTTKLLFRENLSDPAMTYKDLVFPMVSVKRADATGEGMVNVKNGASVDVTLPAVRPTLKCFPNNQDDLEYEDTIVYQNGSDPVGVYQTTLEYPCAANSSVCSQTWEFGQRITNPDANNFVIGYADDVTTVPCGGQNESWYYAIQRGCPALIFGLGNTSFTQINDTAISQDRPSLHAYICYAYLEEVQTQLTLLLPDYTISNDPDHRPVILESTARNTTFSSPFYTGPIYTNALTTLISALEGVGRKIDPIIDTLVQGTDNATAAQILQSPEGIANLPERATLLYASYMVNAISSNFRVGAAQYNVRSTTQSRFTDTLPGATYAGTLTQTNRKRLKQDAKTKIALQVMLGVMALLAICVFLLTDRKLRLPTNPCSIAGTMLLLAGSEMASRNIVPRGSEWSNKTQIWEGWLFSLGWWSDGEGKRFGIDIGNAGAGASGAVGPVGGDPGGTGKGSVASRGISNDFHRTYGHDRTVSVSDHMKPAANETAYAAHEEEHELDQLQSFTPVVVDVPSSRMAWDNDYRFSLSQPLASRYPSEEQQGYEGADAGDLGIAQSATKRSADTDIQRLSDRYRSRVAKKYQMLQ